MRLDETSGHYRFGAIDWQEFNEVIAGRGICNHERLGAKRKAWEEGAWVREAALAHAQNSRLATPRKENEDEQKLLAVI